MRSIALGRWWFSLAFMTMTTGCASAPRAGGPAPPASPAPAAPAARPVAPCEADLVVQEAMNARITVALHLDRVARFRFGRHLAQLGGLDTVLEGTGIDPLRDVQRAFLAARTSHLGQGAIVLHHTADEARVTRAIARLHRAFRATHGAPAVRAGHDGARGEAAALRRRVTDLEARIARLLAVFPDPSRYPFPAAYRVVQRRPARAEPVLIAAPHPGLLVVLPPERVLAAFRLMEVGALADPPEEHAVVLRAWDPESSLAVDPAWTREVRYAEAVLAIDERGDGTLRFRAVCASPGAARAQAARMTVRVERAQTVSIGGARLRLFDPIAFHARDERVEMATRLHAQDVDWIMTMAMRSP